MGGWDWWIYQSQPQWFIKEISEMIEKEWYEHKKEEMSSKMRNKGNVIGA